jgi:hypothetical protein
LTYSEGVSKKAHHIDSVVAPSETRPLGMTNGPTGHFEKALHTFATGGPIPICVGAFGETNTSFDKLVIKLANLAAKTASIRPTTIAVSPPVWMWC